MPTNYDLSGEQLLADAAWLISGDAAPWLALAADQTAPLHQRAAKLRQALSPSRTHLVLEQAELRRRGRAKYDQSERLFFTRRGLQQATDQWIAAYKAGRFPPGEPVADLCCGIGGDSMGLAARVPVAGYDLDPVVVQFSNANVRCVASAEHSGSSASVTDVEGVDLSSFAAWHVDPDRRSDGRRTVDIRHMSPELNVLDRMLAQNENAAIKLAPATTPPAAWQERAELEWISRARECRQLVVWYGRLAQSTAVRRATILDSRGAVAAQVAGAPKPIPQAAPAVFEYVYEPDPSVLAAGLAGQLACRYSMHPLARGVPYFTSSDFVEDAALAAFRVVDVLPADEKKLAAELRARGIGRLEIKCRGVPIVPEKLQDRLRLRGDRHGVLLITPHDGRTIAILAERIEQG